MAFEIDIKKKTLKLSGDENIVDIIKFLKRFQNWKKYTIKTNVNFTPIYDPIWIRPWWWYDVRYINKDTGKNNFTERTTYGTNSDQPILTATSDKTVFQGNLSLSEYLEAPT